MLKDILAEEGDVWLVNGRVGGDFMAATLHH